MEGIQITSRITEDEKTGNRQRKVAKPEIN